MRPILRGCQLAIDILVPNFIVMLAFYPPLLVMWYMYGSDIMNIAITASAFGALGWIIYSKLLRWVEKRL